MSSNLKIKKTCQFCNSEFIAKTTVTKYCCHKCAQKAYKQKKREEKIKAASDDFQNENPDLKNSTEVKNSSPGERGEITGEITNDVFFGGEITNDVITVNEAAKILRVTRKTIYSMIKNGRIKAYNIHKRLTRIDRESVEQLLIFNSKEEKKSEEFDSNDYYNMTQIKTKFNVSSSTIYQKLKEYDVPKKNDGKFVVVPKNIVDLIFKNFI